MEDKITKISEEKAYQLKRELKELKNIKLLEIANLLENARNQDLSENDTDLGSLLEEKESIENRIKEIECILDNSEIYKEKNFCIPDKIEIGSIIKIETDGKTLDIKLVSGIEADPERNYISIESPLGKELIDSKKGDTFELKIRDNITKYKVIEIC